MKKIVAALTCCILLFPSLVVAQTTEEERRVEEQKRESLRSSEAQPSSRQQAASRPITPIDIVYLTELIPRKVAFGYDACKILVILMKVEDEYINLDAQVDFLNKENLLPEKIAAEFDPMKPLRKGVAAYMFCKALEIKGGVILRVFGINQRYAIKELVFQGIMSSGNVRDIISGDELASMLTQSLHYLAKTAKPATAQPQGAQ
ncbi:hypothetical protein ACFL2Y_03180 [Candidatus Omnitrophota bacterium]